LERLPDDPNVERGKIRGDVREFRHTRRIHAGPASRPPGEER
jgi:hypothetical protein